MAPDKPKGTSLSLSLPPPLFLSINTDQLCAGYCARCAGTQAVPDLQELTVHRWKTEVSAGSYTDLQ